MPSNLTKQDKGFIKDVVLNGNATQAVIKNYGIKDTNYAAVKGHELLRKPKIKNVIKSIADEIPDKDLVKKHNDLLKQKQLAYFVFSKSLKDEEIEQHMIANKLDLIVIRESDKGKMAFYSIDDAQAISKALDMAYKIKGTYAPEKTLNLNVNADIINPQALEIAKEYEEKLKKGL